MNASQNEFVSVDWGQTNTKRKKKKMKKALENQIDFLKVPKLQLELKWSRNAFKHGTKANKKKISAIVEIKVSVFNVADFGWNIRLLEQYKAKKKSFLDKRTKLMDIPHKPKSYVTTIVQR